MQKKQLAIPLMMLCIVFGSSCEGSLGSNRDISGADDGLVAQHDMPVISGGDMDPSTREDISPSPQDMDEPIVEQDMEMEDKPITDPNQLEQASLFECKGLPASTPARLRRIDSYELSKNMQSGAASTVPLLPAPDDLYSSYPSNETIDTSILRALLRHNHIPGGTWRAHGNNGNPRIKILRGAGSIADQISCYQISWTGEPSQVEPTEECTRSFVTALLRDGIYFRTPTEGEITRLMEFADLQIQKELADDTTDRNDTITAIVRAAWMTKGALFRDEFGQGEELPDGRRRLSEEELAQVLSIALGHHTAGLSRPGYVNEDGENNRQLQDMYEAAREGVLSDSAMIEVLVRKYLTGSDPSSLYPDVHPSAYPLWSSSYIDQYWMSEKLRRFFQEWLGYANASQIFKDTPEATSRFHDGTLLRDHYMDENYSTYRGRNRQRQNEAYANADLANHLDNTIARIVAEDQDVIARLFNSREFFIPDSLSTVWSGGAASEIDSPYTLAFLNINILETGEVHSLEDRWYSFPEQERAGVLTHPAWLAAHGGNFENDPAIIYRGHWIREHILCDAMPDIPLNVDAMLDPETQDQSARNRVKSATEEDAYCSSCHALMNPLGYPFEVYNHAGFVRAEDHGAAPNGSSILSRMPPDSVLQSDMRVNNAAEMMDLFAESPRVKRCFIRQSFRYFVGRDETLNDACTLQQMEQAYDTSGGSLVSMLVALFQSDSFLLRHTPQEMP